MYEFAYQKPTSVADAVKALRATPTRRRWPGGQTFIPVLKQRLAKPTEIVDLAKLGMTGDQGDRQQRHHRRDDDARRRRELARRQEGHSRPRANSRAGSATTRCAIAARSAARSPTTIRAACYPAAVLALGATIKTDRRTIEADDYFQGMFTTALEPGELITAVEFPIPAKARYQKFRNPASRYAMVGVFVANGPKGVRVAVTGAGQGGVFRHTAMEEALAKNWSPDAVASITTPADGLNSDIHGSAEYRAHLVTVMAKRAVAATR